jgi:hypothetical protein
MVGEEFARKSLRGSFNKEKQQKHAEWYYY